MVTVQVKVEGRSPLLMNPFTDQLFDQIRTKTPKPKNTDRTVQAEAAEKMYRSPEGAIGIPVENFLSCLVEAGRQVKSGKSAISTKESTKLFSFLSVQETFLPFDPQPDEQTGWEADCRRGRLPKDGTAVPLVRPKFPIWGFTCTLEIDEKLMNPETVRSLVEVAGNSVGLCDFRPACRGPFGRFRVTDWQVQNGNGASR